ncbi:MAG TPA: LytR C-terminal domain-containing protein [Gaiellaceae bacterium]|nr:LytR C-terminal domain-containing protein [Gaiellaceae bacterium]
MDAPLDTHDALIRPWRTATLVATLIAALELVLLMGAGAMLLAKPLSRALRHHAEASVLAPIKKTTPVHHAVKAPPPKAKLPRARTGVFVFNGNGVSGAASTEAARLQHLGYRIPGTGNAKREDYATTVVMYRRGFTGEGLRLARDLHVSAIGPLDGVAPSALHGAQLAVVVGAG